MSKIKLAPNGIGSGEFTIAAPGTSTNRVMTLPDVTGTAVVNQGDGIFAISANGNVGIGTSTPASKLEISGSFAATTKAFLIKHPTKEGMQLRHGSLEGPENGVYIRGRLQGSNVIELPDYWVGLVYEDSITVTLTPIGRSQNVWIESIENNQVLVSGMAIDCYYLIMAERKDVEKLVVEF
jgi:hypothetical protein